MKSVLVLGDSSDPHTIVVIKALERLGSDYFITDLWNDFQDIPYSIGETVAGFHSVWNRLKPRAGNITEVDSFVLRERRESIFGYLSKVDPSKFINYPWAVEKAHLKPYQLAIAKELGITIPKTLVSSSPDEIARFCRSNEKTIYKPLSWLSTATGEILFTNVISEELIRHFSKEVSLAPGIYQEYIEKDYELRITVMDNEIFAVKIDSQQNDESKTDWRRNQLDVRYELAKTDPKICSQVLTLNRALGLRYGAYDVIKSKTKGYVFLEVNPNGNWLWLEERLDLGISEKIAKSLLAS